MNNALASIVIKGKPIRYLIGAESGGKGGPNVVTMCPFDSDPAEEGVSFGYCNHLDENYADGRYAPYIEQSDTAREYKEGMIDPDGAGWSQNLNDQFCRRKGQEFSFIEIDNAGDYELRYVMAAIELAKVYGLGVIAKNPGLRELNEALTYVAHSNVFGAIVEEGAGAAHDMNELRRLAGKHDLPVWFVAYGDGRKWANQVAREIREQRYINMGVTFSTHGEYKNAIDLYVPRAS